MARSLALDAMRRLCAKALASGAERKSSVRVEWDTAGDCQSPYLREFFARPSSKERWRAALKRTFPGWTGEGPVPGGPTYGRTMRRYLKRVEVTLKSEHALWLQMWQRCRRCSKCLARRQTLWRQRALAELRAAPRTWFGTITLRPEEQFKFLSQARQRCTSQGVDFEALDFGEQFRLRHAEISRELTKFLKRVRKASGAPLRYLLVAEQHKSGAPHYHILIHEVDPLQPIKHACLTEQWTLGFTKFKLVGDEPHKSVYLTKYLSKSAAARVRASQNYGDTAAYAIAFVSALRQTQKSVGNMSPKTGPEPTSDGSFT